MSFVSAPMSFVLAPMSFVSAPMSCVSAPMSYVLAPMSFVSAPMSFVSAPMSCVSAPMSFASAPELRVSSEVAVRLPFLFFLPEAREAELKNTAGPKSSKLIEKHSGRHRGAINLLDLGRAPYVLYGVWYG